MTVLPATLAPLAEVYTRGMTSIRGRRVQRLIQRQFAGAEGVLSIRLASDGRAIVGTSATGAALCATDGRGRHASVFKWWHGASDAVEERYDLHRDSLPLLDSTSVSLRQMRERLGPLAADEPAAHEPHPLVRRALEALVESG